MFAQRSSKLESEDGAEGKKSNEIRVGEGRGAKTASNEHLLPPRNLSLCSLPLLRRSNPTQGSTPTAGRVLCQLMFFMIMSPSTFEVNHPQSFVIHYALKVKSWLLMTIIPVCTRVLPTCCEAWTQFVRRELLSKLMCHFVVIGLKSRKPQRLLSSEALLCHRP